MRLPDPTSMIQRHVGTAICIGPEPDIGVGTDIGTDIGPDIGDFIQDVDNDIEIVELPPLYKLEASAENGGQLAFALDNLCHRDLEQIGTVDSLYLAPNAPELVAAKLMPLAKQQEVLIQCGDRSVEVEPCVSCAVSCMNPNAERQLRKKATQFAAKQAHVSADEQERLADVRVTTEDDVPKLKVSAGGQYGRRALVLEQETFMPAKPEGQKKVLPYGSALSAARREASRERGREAPRSAHNVIIS